MQQHTSVIKTDAIQKKEVNPQKPVSKERISLFICGVILALLNTTCDIGINYKDLEELQLNHDVYVAGYIITESERHAVLWRNNAEIRLSSSGESEARCVAVSGNNVYVAGYEMIDGIAQATLWLNGNAQHLGEGAANKVFVLNGNVYVGGNNYSYPDMENNNMVWKGDSLWKNIDDWGKIYPFCSMYVSGDDIYVAGQTGDDYYGWGTAYVRKNSEGVERLTPGVSYADHVFVANGNVYVVGYAAFECESCGYSHALWTNGEVEKLLEVEGLPVLSSDLVCVTEDGDIVVVSGTYGGIGIWVNGIQKLTHLIKDVELSAPTSMQVADGTLYMTGTLNNHPALWTNQDEVYKLSSRPGEALS
ncbi:MAG: hypothetical protein LBP25_03370, partial [Tannerellaceae bacterium]|nr:hypothetical protein [Tannerellaceae bacterium]